MVSPELLFEHLKSAALADTLRRIEIVVDKPAEHTAGQTRAASGRGLEEMQCAPAAELDDQTLTQSFADIKEEGR